MTPQVEFSKADELRGTHLGDLMAAARCRLIIVAGPHDSGKTTLIASMYREFCQGSFAGYQLSGSRTRRGLEQRSHQARISSRLSTPNTEHTRLADTDRYLHFRVRRIERAGPHVEMVVSDWPGEFFRLATSIQDDAKALWAVKRSDELVVLLDGKKIVDLGQRHRAIADTDMFVRRMHEVGLIGSGSSVSILLTKMDWTESDSAPDDTGTLLDNMEREMKRKYKRSLGRLRFYRTAARATAPGTTVLNGAGLGKVFQSWTTTKVKQIPNTPEVDFELDLSRQFDRFGSRSESKRIG